MYLVSRAVAEMMAKVWRTELHVPGRGDPGGQRCCDARRALSDLMAGWSTLMVHLMRRPDEHLVAGPDRTPEVVRFHWRTNGPVTLASDSRSKWFGGTQFLVG